MLTRHLLRRFFAFLATLLLLWQAAGVMVQAMPVRHVSDNQSVSACDCTTWMCHPELLYHARLKEYVVGSVGWSHGDKIPPVPPELRPELKVSLVLVAAPAPGHVRPDQAERIPVASPFLRSPKLLL